MPPLHEDDLVLPGVTGVLETVKKKVCFAKRQSPSVIRLRRHGNPLKLVYSGPAKGDPPWKEGRACVWLEGVRKGGMDLKDGGLEHWHDTLIVCSWKKAQALTPVKTETKGARGLVDAG